jgi:hypothetical protein
LEFEGKTFKDVNMRGDMGNEMRWRIRSISGNQGLF